MAYKGSQNLFPLGPASGVARTDGFVAWISVTGRRLADGRIGEANL